MTDYRPGIHIGRSDMSFQTFVQRAWPREKWNGPGDDLVYPFQRAMYEFICDLGDDEEVYLAHGRRGGSYLAKRKRRESQH